MTPDEIRSIASAAGFTGEALDVAVAVALAESSGNPSAIGDRDLPARGCRSYGLWQINSCPARDANSPTRYGSDPTRLLDPATNAAAAYAISSRGTNWRPWTTHRNGAYRRHLPSARGGRLSLVGVPAGLPPLITPAAPSIAGSLDPVPDVLGVLDQFTRWETWRRVLYVVGAIGLGVGGTMLILRQTTNGTPNVIGPSTSESDSERQFDGDGATVAAVA